MGALARFALSRPAGRDLRSRAQADRPRIRSMADFDRVGLVRSAWEAINRGGIDAALPLLATDARGRAVEDGPWNCEGRAAIARFFSRREGRAPAGRLESAVEVDGRVVVGFRPDQPADDGWPLEEGVRYLVVSVAGGLITELKGCASQAVALAYARDPTPPPTMA